MFSLLFASVQLFFCRAVRLCLSVFFPAAFLTQTVCLDDTTVKFEIWDTAGQERYHSLAPMYYRGAQAAIVVYDITNTVSHVTSAKTWGRPVTVFKFWLISGYRRPLLGSFSLVFCLNGLFFKALSLWSRIHLHVQRTGWRNCSDKPAPTSLSHWQETKQIWPTSAP